MTALNAFRDGIRRVNEAPLVVAGMIVVTLLIALPFSLVLRGMLAAELGASAAAERVAERADDDWWEEFTAQASGLGATFTPSVIGFAAVLENTGGLLDNQPLAAGIAGATIAWLVVWSFLSGGVMDRYARRRPTRAHGFFGACGTHFWRFLRLGAIAWCAYLVLFGWVHRWIFDGAYLELTRDVTVERTAFLVRLAAYALFAAVLAWFALLFDYARIRIVVEDRRSALGALLAARRFTTRHARTVCALFLLNAAALATLMAAYGVLSPGAPPGDIRMWLVLLVGEAYIAGRHYIKLLVYASETALFQSSLAHAAYTAAPSLVWPDSPAVETITNAEPTAAR
jgi:hypothetical protein